MDGLDSVDDLERYSPPPLLCLVERENGGMGADEKVTIGMIVICPSTGDVVWDEFDGICLHYLIASIISHWGQTITCGLNLKYYYFYKHSVGPHW